MQKYDIFYIDPPWNNKKGGLRESRPNQTRELDYTTLDISDIFKIIDSKILTYAFDLHTVFIWAIDKTLFKCEQEMEKRGYKQHARIIWDKENGVAPAFTIRYAHEYLLWYYKPKMLLIDPNMRGKYTTVLREKIVRHSQKPEIAYKFIEDLYPTASKLELFARNKRVGWTCWGNEISNDII